LLRPGGVETVAAVEVGGMRRGVGVPGATENMEEEEEGGGEEEGCCWGGCWERMGAGGAIAAMVAVGKATGGEGAKEAEEEEEEGGPREEERPGNQSWAKPKRSKSCLMLTGDSPVLSFTIHSAPGPPACSTAERKVRYNLCVDPNRCWINPLSCSI